MNEDLKYAFSNVNDWLKFAESKNAALFALNIASIIGLLQIDKNISPFWPSLRGVLVLLFSLSATICVVSIIPRVTALIKDDDKMPDAKFVAAKKDLNFLFFEHITKLSTTQFFELFKSKLPGLSLSSADEDLANQIVNNAKIASAKYRMFGWASWLTVTGFIFTIAGVIILAFAK